MFCSSCGQENDDGANFCSGCGGALGSATPPTVKPSAASVATPSSPTAGPSQPWYERSIGGLRGGVIAALAAFVVIAVVLLIVIFTGSDERVRQPERRWTRREQAL